MLRADTRIRVPAGELCRVPTLLEADGAAAGLSAALLESKQPGGEDQPRDASGNIRGRWLVFG